VEKPKRFLNICKQRHLVLKTSDPVSNHETIISALFSSTLAELVIQILCHLKRTSKKLRVCDFEKDMIKVIASC
jgi:hypothetical protein